MQTNHSKPLLSSMASLLTELAEEIESLSAALCHDPAVLANHLSDLQGIDLAAQKARQMALVLEADCAVQGVDDVRLDSLRTRLQDCT